MTEYYDDCRTYPDYDTFTWEKIYHKNEFKPEFTADETYCSTCGDADGKYVWCWANLYGVEFARKVKVFAWQCGCHKQFFYDGCDDHILNYNNKELFTHTLLNLYTMEIWTESQPSFRAYYSKIVAMYEENGSSIKLPSRPRMACLWRTFIHLQQWKFSNVCPACDRGLTLDRSNDTCVGKATGEVTNFGMCQSLLFIIF